jgi:WD40 repeat protein
LSAFTEQDEHLFFGREKFVQQLVDAVKQQQNPLVPVIGASGSGKSSVVLAGLIPRLRAERNWLIESFRPQSQPFYELASALVLACYPELKKEERKDDRKERVTKLFDQFEGNRKLWQEVRDILKEHPGKRLLLVVDQFEELYALDNKQEFVNALLEAIKLNPRFKLVLTIRTDFLDYIINDPPFKDVALKPDIPQYLGAMNDEKDIKSVIELTDHRRTEKIVTLEDGLTDIIWKEVKQEPGNLPLLEFALTQLWEKNGGGILTNQTYIKIGGVNKALANHADDIYKNLKEPEKKQFKQIFVQLARPGEFVQPVSPGQKVDVAEEEKRRGQQSFDQKVDIAEEKEKREHKSFVTPDTRRLATRAEIGEGNWRLVQKLAAEDREKKLPLLVTGRNENTGEQTVEVVHEVLIREWEELQGWINYDRTFLTWRDLLRINIAQWKKGEASLLRDQPLATAEDWLQERSEDLTNEREYIQQSLQLREREKAEKERQEREKLEAQVALDTETERNLRLTDANQKAKQRIRISSIFLGVSVCLAAIFFGSAFIFFQKQQEAQQGTKLEQAGVNALRQMPSGEIDALLSAMQAGQELKQMIRDNRTLKDYPATSPLLALQKILDTIQEQNRIDTDQKKINSVAFSPDGNYIATAGDDDTVVLWSPSGEKKWTKKGVQRVLADSAKTMNFVTFSPDGQKITAGEGDGTITMWDISGNQLSTFKASTTNFKSLSFSPDGQKIATGDEEKARLWDLSGKQLAEFIGHKGRVNSISFSPNGQQVATAGYDGTIRLWEVSGKQLKQFIAHEEQEILSLSFSPDGKYIATSAKDNIARLWNLSKQESVKLEGHQGSVLNVGFSRDGKNIATTSNDGTVRLWDLSGKPITILQGHRGSVSSASFRPDGKYLITGGADNTARIWNLSKYNQPIKQFKGHQKDVNSISFSSSGQQIVTADHEGIVKLWNLSGQEQASWQADRRGSLWSVNFSPDGQLIATGGYDQLKTRLKGHQGAIYSLSFSSNGQMIVTSGADKTARLWNLSGKLLATLEGHQNVVERVIFSPDKKTIVTGGWDGNIKIWDLFGKKIKEWQTKQGKISGLSFSPDGKQLATADKSGVIKIWDLSGNQHLEFFSYQTGVSSLSFSYNGQYLASGGMDSTVRLWNLKGYQITEYKTGKGAIWGISFSPDGKSIVAGGDNGFVQIWQIKPLDELLSQGCDWLESYREQPAAKEINILSICN